MQGPQHIPLPEVGEEDDVDVSDEDLQFVSSHHADLDFLEKLPKRDLDRWVGGDSLSGAGRTGRA